MSENISEKMSEEPNIDIKIPTYEEYINIRDEADVLRNKIESEKFLERIIKPEQYLVIREQMFKQFEKKILYSAKSISIDDQLKEMRFYDNITLNHPFINPWMTKDGRFINISTPIDCSDFYRIVYQYDNLGIY